MPKPASLTVSKCKRFAFFRNSFGESLIVTSKEFARFMVQSGLTHGVLTSLDAHRLEHEILLSGLPEYNADVPVAIQAATRSFNMIMPEGENGRLPLEAVARGIIMAEKEILSQAS